MTPQDPIVTKSKYRFPLRERSEFPCLTYLLQQYLRKRRKVAADEDYQEDRAKDA